MEAIQSLVLNALLRMDDLISTDPDEACIGIPPFRVESPILNTARRRTCSKDFQHMFCLETNQPTYFIPYIASKFDNGRKGLATDATNQIANLANVSYKVDRDHHGELGSLDAGLRERSVNVASDEQLLIANLLDMDVANMLNGPCPLASCTSVGYNPSRVHRM